MHNHNILKTVKLFSIYFISISLLIVILTYLFIILALPKILNSEKTLNQANQYLKKHFNVEFIIDNYNISINPKIKVVFVADDILIRNKSEKAIEIKDIKISSDILRGNINYANIKDLYIDIDNFIEILSQNKSSQKSTFKIEKLYDLSIDNIKIISRKKVPLIADISNLKIINNISGEKAIDFKANIVLPKKLPIIKIDSQNNLIISDNILKAQNLLVMLDGTPIHVDGEFLNPQKIPDLHIWAQNLKSQKVVDMAIFIHNIFDKHKKFLENFKDFTGYLSVDIYIKDKKMNGIITANNLKAKTVKFNIPVICKYTKLTIKDNVMEGISTGLAGTEKITHKLKITDLLSKENRLVIGEVNSTITEQLVQKYMPPKYNIKGNSKIYIVYRIKNQKINVEYYADLKKGTDLFYKHINLGLVDENRRFYLHTYKSGENMYLKNYDYSMIKNGVMNNIILGDGLFIRINNKFKPQYITVKTNGFAPMHVIGSFDRYVYGGEFKGDLKYDFNNLKLTGKFLVQDTYFNNFLVKQAKILADEKNLNVIAEGTYKKEKFISEMYAKNNLFEEDRMQVYNLDLFLDKFRITKNQPNHKYQHHIDISKEVRKINMDIEKYKIKVDSVYFHNAVATNFNVVGSLKNALFNFDISDINFANGTMRAKGKYDFNNDSSSIDYIANNIDSSIVADKVFDLPNQIVGIANAIIHIDTYNRMNDLQGKFKFSINGGDLLQLGHADFLLSKANEEKGRMIKFFPKVDLSKAKKLNSDIQCSFDVNNYTIKNINLTLQQEALGLFVDGQYDLMDKLINLNLYGKYDQDNLKKIKINHIPVSVLMFMLMSNEKSKVYYQPKLNKIPSINATVNDTKYFRVKVAGDIKSNKIFWEIKGIK